MNSLTFVRRFRWPLLVTVLVMATSVQAQTRSSPARLLGRATPARPAQTQRAFARPSVPSQPQTRQTSQFYGGGANSGGMNQGGSGSTGATALGMVPRAMPAPVGGGLNNGNMGNTSNNGMSANNGGFRYVTVPTPRATSQAVARQFFAAGGIRFDTQNQNLNSVQPQR